jgi:hypothetical protein
MPKGYVRFRYEGPQVFVVALQRDVRHGDEFDGPPELEHNYGFTRVEKAKKPEAKLEGDS